MQIEKLIGRIRIIQLSGTLGPKGGARSTWSTHSLSTISVFCVSQTTAFSHHRHAFLAHLVFSAVVYASAAFAATIPIGGCDEATAKDIEIDIAVYHKQLAEVSEQLVFPMINSPLNTDIHVIVCIYAFSNLHTSLSKNLICFQILVLTDLQCQAFPTCKTCGPNHLVSLARALE